MEHAAAQRDFVIELLKVTKADEEKAQQLERLREERNRLQENRYFSAIICFHGIYICLTKRHATVCVKNR